MPFPEPQPQAVAHSAKSAGGNGGELLALTSIRGIAAWWVVLFHLRLLLVPWLPGGAIHVLAQGNLAVDLFFILSGFVIALNYGDRLAGDWRATGDFLFRRFARIYPLHLLILCGFAAYVGSAILFGSQTLERQHPGYFVASLFLVQNWGLFGELRWNVPAWSISTEAFAYLLFPILIRLVLPIRRSAWLLAVLVLALGLAVPAFFALTGYAFPNAVPQTGLFRCVVQFAMGMLLYELWRALRGRPLALPLIGPPSSWALPMPCSACPSCRSPGRLWCWDWH